MNADRIQIQEGPSRVFQNRKGESTQLMEDNRVQSACRLKWWKLCNVTRWMRMICCKVSSPFSGMWKMRNELLQRKICGPTANEEPDRDSGSCNPRHGVFLRDGFLFGTCTPGFIEGAGGWALAYTQGTDIHFAPGQFEPDTSAGQQLLGHELTHVIQQAEGRVQLLPR